MALADVVEDALNAAIEHIHAVRAEEGYPLLGEQFVPQFFEPDGCSGAVVPQQIHHLAVASDLLVARGAGVIERGDDDRKERRAVRQAVRHELRQRARSVQEEELRPVHGGPDIEAIGGEAIGEGLDVGQRGDDDGSFSLSECAADVFGNDSREEGVGRIGLDQVVARRRAAEDAVHARHRYHRSETRQLGDQLRQFLGIQWLRRVRVEARRHGTVAHLVAGMGRQRQGPYSVVPSPCTRAHRGMRS